MIFSNWMQELKHTLGVETKTHAKSVTIERNRIISNMKASENTVKTAEKSMKTMENAAKALETLKRLPRKAEDEADLMRMYYLSDGRPMCFFPFWYLIIVL